jgi:hypothetical protein
MKLFMKGEWSELPRRDLKKLSRKAEQFVLDAAGTMYVVSRATPERPGNALGQLRLVVPVSLRQDLLNHCHTDFQGGHQGISRTFETLRAEYYWPGLYADAERYVQQCVDCVTSKGRPQNFGPSPGNILATYPFEVLSMDNVIPLPESADRNIALLLFQDLFSGFVMCKPMRKTTA